MIRPCRSPCRSRPSANRQNARRYVPRMPTCQTRRPRIVSPRRMFRPRRCAERAVRGMQAVGIGRPDLMLIARIERVRPIGHPHALAPCRQHLLVGQTEYDVGFEVVTVLDQTLLAFEPVPKRRARQRLQQIHRQQRNLRALDKFEQVLAAVRRIGVEAENDSRHHLQAVAVQRLDGFEDRHRRVVFLGDGLERHRVRRLDAAEHRFEHRFAHQRENFRPLGDVQRRFAGQRIRIAVALLPIDQVRQELPHGAPVRDEIVVDEIHRAEQPAGQHLVEFGADLRGGLESRIASVERGNVAELALVGTAAGELDAADEITAELRQLIGRDRKLGELAPLARGQHDLADRARGVLLEPREQFVGCVAHLADMQVVEIRIVFGTGRDRRAAQHNRPVERMGAAPDVLHLPPLHVHAADKHDLRPGEIVFARFFEILVDETNLPARRHGRCDHQQALRRHERANPVGQRVRKLERTERGRVAWKYTQ